MFLSFVKLDQTWPTEGKLTTAAPLVRVGSQLPQPEISCFWSGNKLSGRCFVITSKAKTPGNHNIALPQICFC